MRGYDLADQKNFGFLSRDGKGGAHFASILPTGIPIGNLTSQFFANIYLNGLDHFIKERLKCRYYLRYMDDFVIFHDDKNFLWQAKVEVQKYLRALRLTIHENKCRIFNTRNGIPFLGLVISRDR
ncbi:MAG: RNA-directed DNA polymerase, partial [Deltaproteobacteria bacterium]|nr:RNA-directed DNA polymerase [Deltaproteobacteria bacterium]